MAKVIISGIQQIGVGVPSVYPAWDWYIEYFGANARIFDDVAVADIMAPYMGGQERPRHAILAMNLQGGGGFEIWQHTSTPPNPPSFTIKPGDLGINYCIVKCKDPDSLYETYKGKGADLSPMFKDENGQSFFYITDPYNNTFRLVKSTEWFTDRKKPTGGVYGAVIGTPDIEESMRFYKYILGYDTVISDRTGYFDDFDHFAGSKHQYRRVLLTHSQKRQGPFSEVLGSSYIELVQAMDRTDIRKIYEGRMWGDIGFIQLCFDINNMTGLSELCAEIGYPFTIDSRKKSKDFGMGEAAGNFAYNEDPSGTLIEYVETKKVPILKKFGIYLNLEKHNPEKPLPRWIVKSLRFMEKKK